MLLHATPLHATGLLAIGLLASAPRAHAWDADASVIPSFTDVATVTTTGGASSAAAVNDGDDQTSWQSDSCFPTGFLTRADLNPIADACASGGCTVTDQARSMAPAGDLPESVNSMVLRFSTAGGVQVAR